MRYIALTIGPILKTLQNAKKTRELWGGSYIFSYIMKEIIKHFQDRDFIVPYIQDKTIFEKGKGVGLFHDRFIFESKEGDLERLEDVVDEVLNQLSKDTKIDIYFLEEYFQINFFEKALKKGDNPILKLSSYLDTAELFYKVPQYKENALQKFLKERINNSFLVRDAFDTKRTSFPSLPEIALTDLKDTFSIREMLKDDELEIYEDTPLKKELKNYHKYIAIVQADGDNMGEVVKNLKTKEDFNTFSKKLFEYCENAHTLITQFGGTTIFAGGDDLLFFAPVVNNNKSIFNLCDEISNMFDGLFQNYDTSPKATLSFGVSITYYKHPLYEALNNTRELLFSKAKTTGTKNNIAFKVIKHSGQTFESVISKNNQEIYDNFIVFSSNINEGKDVDNFLHSLHHKIDTYTTTLIQIAHNKDKLQNFFDNYFNEEVHAEYRDFFALLIDFIYAVFQDKRIKNNNKLNTIYATLRFVKFIKGDKQ